MVGWWERAQRRWLLHRIDAAWGRIGRGIERTGPEPTAGEAGAAWASCVARLRDLFTAHAGAEAVAHRFDVPADYAAFMASIGGGWRWLAGRGAQQELFSATVVAESTADEFELWVTGRDDEVWTAERGVTTGPQDDGFWLSIGWYGDKHAILLCCDLAHPYYGCVIDHHDGHPWYCGADSVFVTVLGRSFLGWLRALGSRD